MTHRSVLIILLCLVRMWSENWESVTGVLAGVEISLPTTNAVANNSAATK